MSVVNSDSALIPALVSKSLCPFSSLPGFQISSFPVLNSLNASILKFFSYFSPVVIFKHFFCVCLHFFLSIPLGNGPCYPFKPFFHPDSPSWSHCPFLRHLCQPPALLGPSSGLPPFPGGSFFYFHLRTHVCFSVCPCLLACITVALAAYFILEKDLKFFSHACWLKP